jgi:thiol-disulfide isomerase/thioredoxin
MSSLRNRVTFAIAALLALAAGAGLAIWDRTPKSADALLALSLPDTAGAPQPLNQWRGKVVVINFWATWCEPCREEMPEFVRTQKEYGSRGLQFVGIAIDKPDKVERFAKELQLNYPALIAGYDVVELTHNLGNPLSALPFTVVLDRSGRVVQTHLGPFKAPELKALVNDLL